MKKGLYVSYNEVAKAAEEPFYCNTDEYALLRFTNSVNAMKAQSKQNKVIMPFDKISLYRVGWYDDELLTLTQDKKLLTTGDQCRAFEEE